GSDGPWLNPALELHKVRLLDLPAPATARITGGNLLELIAPAARRLRARGRTLVRGGATVAVGRDPWHADADVASVP
ncbi:MAG: hypothetical protein ACXVWT_25560, partial [Solirubrobacteraceae bacterium]